MSKKSYIVLILFILFLFQILVSQEKGNIAGFVYDSKTGKPLAYANVLIKGSYIGAATNDEGRFEIRDVSPGEYTLLVRYIGYIDKEIAVVVNPGKEAKVDIPLDYKGLELQEVVVTAQASGQLRAINEQLNALTVKNVVSSEKIQELPDASAAAALSRLPGISLQEGDKVVIRGIQAKQNVVLMNGVELPSTDLNDRSVNLGFISSNMLSGIEVTKVLTPDMDANALGGVVNLKLMEAPEGFRFDVYTQGSYNLLDRTTDNYKSWLSVSNRFFNNKLGVYLQGHIDRTNGGIDNASAGFAIDDPTALFGEGAYRMNNFTFTDQENLVTNKGGSIVLDYVLPKGKFILQNALSYNNNDVANYRTVLDFANTLGTFSLFRDINSKQLMINSFLMEYNFGKLKTELSLSHSYSNKDTDLRYGDPGQNFGFTDNYPFGIGNQYTAERDYFTPEDVYNIAIDDSAYYRAYLSGWAVMRWEKFDQHLYDSRIDFSFPLKLSKKISSKIKFGGKFKQSIRENDVDEAYKRTGDLDMYNGVDRDTIDGRLYYLDGHIVRDMDKPMRTDNPLMFYEVMNSNYTRGKYYLNGDYPINYVVDKDLMDIFMPRARSGWPLLYKRSVSERYDFDGTEDFLAGYLMGIFNIGSRMTLIGGIRYEEYKMDYKSTFVQVTHSVDGLCILYDTLNTVDRTDINFFPNIQMKYKMAEGVDLRLAYTKAISRPDYLAIIPNIYYEPGAYGQAGNPFLKPTVIDNYDAAITMYGSNIGLLTIAPFYKKLKDVFFSTQIYYRNLEYYNVNFPDSATFEALGIRPPAPSLLISSYVNNSYPGYLRGIEFEWQSNLWYLPKPFNSLVININYTRTWSNMNYLRLENIDSTWTEGRFTKHKYKTVEKKYKGRLINQGDHILNFVIGIDYKGFSGRLSFNLQDAVTSYVGNRPEDDQITGTVTRWDLTVKQRLPIEGFSISFNAVNLFSRPIKNYRKFKRPGQEKVINNLVNTIYTPSFYELVLRYNF